MGPHLSRDVYQPGMPPLQFQFPGGDVTVEIIPESSKVNINDSLPVALFGCFRPGGCAGPRPAHYRIHRVNWRTPSISGQPTPIDAFYLQQNPSFMAAHTSFQEIEESAARSRNNPGPVLWDMGP